MLRVNLTLTPLPPSV